MRGTDIFLVPTGVFLEFDYLLYKFHRRFGTNHLKKIATRAQEREWPNFERI